MAVWSIVKYSELGIDGRIDPEFYRPGYLTKRAKIEKANHVLIGDIAFVSDGIHMSPDWVEEGGVPCYSAKHVKDNHFVLYEFGRISEKQNKSNKKTWLKEGDVLLTSVGTIGNCAVVRDYILPANIDRHVGFIRLNEDSPISPYYLSTFLNSNLGRFQTLRLATGNVQLNLFIDKMITIAVPVSDQSEEIAIATEKAYDLFDVSRSLLAEAEGMLLDELGLSNLELPKAKWNVRNFSETRTEERIDAEYYLPRYYAIFDVLNKKGCSRLNEIADVPIKRRFKAEKGEICNYVEISDIDVSNGSAEYTERPFEELPANAKLRFKGGELIISKVRPTRGAIAVLPSLGNKAVCSGAFTMAEIESPLREVVMVWLRSEYGKMLLERPCTGGQYPTITDNDVENVLIPNLSEPVAEQISAKVRESHSARAEAKRLLETAKRKVEEMILEGK